MLAEAGSFDLSSIRLASSAGESLFVALYERFKARFGIDILDGIGSTEVLHTFIANRPGAIRPGSSGQVVPGYEARLLDDDGRGVASNEIGNLWIKGDSICAEYWNQPEKTTEAIDEDWIRTGDKYSVDANGYYWARGPRRRHAQGRRLWVSPARRGKHPPRAPGRFRSAVSLGTRIATPGLGEADMLRRGASG